MTNIPDLSTAHILIAGDIMLDRYWHGPAQRISPEAPVPVVQVSETENRAGGAGNVALNITSLGAKASLIAATGDDEESDVLQNLLSDQGIESHFIKVKNSRTITKLRVISHHQQLIRLDFEDGFGEYQSSSMTERFKQQLDQVNAVILSDYGKGSLGDIQSLITLCRQHNTPVLIDPKGTDFEKYRNATLLTPNLSEFEAVVGACADDETLVEKGTALLEKLTIDALLVTRGAQGMTLLQRGAEPFHLGTQAREVFDVTGAGDTVIASLATALAAGQDLRSATSLANLTAGIVVGKLGTATASIEEVHAAAQVHQPLKRGVTTEPELMEILERARANGERIVMTNGCFDILHPGHVAYLSQARELGDRLIIAVNDDDSVKRLKGASRPVNTLMQRMAVLSALESVDWVVPFTEDTPERLIKATKPNVLVKGGDYKPEQIAGADFVKSLGGEVVIKAFIDGVSTTAIIEAIQKLDK